MPNWNFTGCSLRNPSYSYELSEIGVPEDIASVGSPTRNTNSITPEPHMKILSPMIPIPAIP